MDAPSHGRRPRPTFRRGRQRPSALPVLAILALVGAVLAIALPAATLLAHAHSPNPSGSQAATAAPTPRATRKVKHARASERRRPTGRVRTTAKPTPTVTLVAAATSSTHPASTAKKLAPAKRTLATMHVSARRAAKVAAPRLSLAAYAGLGSWVDIYDTSAFASPAATVRDMASHGVKTLYIETANYHSAAVNNPKALAAFIRECHARHMRIVAWYLPSLKSGSGDFSRISQAIKFKTADGQHFDSFALDIESTVVSSVGTRNKNLAALSKRIRKLVGKTYPLGAISPSPVGLSQKRGYWNAFPYAKIASLYDVFLPMGYYTYHGHGASAAHADAAANIRILRSQKGCASKPIHLIGGLSDDSSAAEVKAFVSATREGHVLGASIYGWARTTNADWKALSKVK